jgi:PAS domain S-box-containing protein
VVNDLLEPTPSTQTEPADLPIVIGARTLHVVLLGLLGLMALAVPAVVFVFVKKAANSILLLVMLTLVLVSGVLARRGRVRLASLVLVSGTWLLCATIVVLSGGPTSPNNGMLIAVTFVAGLLLGLRVAVVTGIVSCVVGLCVLVLESQGLGPPRYFPLPPAAAWVATSLALFMALVPLHIALKSLTGALRDQRREIAERRRAERALRERTDLLDAQFDNSPDLILIVDRDGRVITINHSMAPGFSLEAVRGQEAVALLPPEEQEKVRRALRRCLETGEPQELQHLLMGGRIVHARISPLRWEGTVDRLLVISTDITERTRLESQLREAQKMATMASIVGAVAHEVRNPLFAISATLDAFEARPEAMGGRQVFVDRLREQVNRMSLLMQELLDYGRPYTPTLVTGPLQPVIARALAIHRELAEGRGVRLEAELPEKLPEIALDAPRLLQVFENLIKNAIEHSTVGGVVRVEAREATEGGVRLVECRVRDDGPGFDGVDLDQVFEPFYSRRPGGTGLGLSIAWRFTREHEGTITAGNHPEGGAMFTVRLPAAG